MITFVDQKFGLRCNAPGTGCLATFGPIEPCGGDTAAECDEVRRRARKLGWSTDVVHGLLVDVCPMCSRFRDGAAGEASEKGGG